MAIVAPVSSYRISSYKITIIVCLAASIWLAYDGYFNESFQAKHADDLTTLAINRYAPFVLVPVAIAAGVIMAMLRKKKIVIDNKSLVLDDGRTIPLDSIEKVDKTFFEKKGRFEISWSDGNSSRSLVLSYLKWDNLEEILDAIVTHLNAGSQG